MAAAIETAGFDGVWVGEVNDLDAVVPATLAAVGTETAAVGVLLNTFTRAPTTLAMTASTLAACAPGRAHVVLGAASPLLVQRWNGIPYERPFARLRDCLRFVRAALTGERVDGAFETFSTSGFRLPHPPDPAPSLLVAASGLRALQLATEEADGVVLNWIDPMVDLDAVHPLPEQRNRISVVLSVCPSRDQAIVREVMTPILTSYLNVPAYAEQQRRLGRGDALAATWEAWSRGDAAGAAKALPDSLFDAFVVSGDPNECRDRLDEIERVTGARIIATYFLPPDADFLATVSGDPP